MPGLLSTIFEDGAVMPGEEMAPAENRTQTEEEESGSYDAGTGQDEGGSSSESQSSQYDAQAGGGVDLSPSIGVSHSADASWEDSEGTTHSWSNDTDIVMTADVDAALGGAGSLGQSGMDAG